MNRMNCPRTSNESFQIRMNYTVSTADDRENGKKAVVKAVLMVISLGYSSPKSYAYFCIFQGCETMPRPEFGPRIFD